MLKNRISRKTMLKTETIALSIIDLTLTFEFQIAPCYI
jgi:hypothetical protein